MGIACVILFIAQTFPQLKGFLEGFGILWGQLLSVTTFTLTFFLNQSYALWRKCYELSRRLQGRLNDLGLLLATHASRKTPSSPNDPSTYTPASRQLLELIARYIRLFNLLTYASFTRSHRPILTPRGMRRMVERGILTAQERQVLVDAEVPATQRHNAVIMWIMRLYIEGRAAGHLQGGSGHEQQFLEKCHVIRAQYGAIGDELQGRMPLAYVHIVQVLVDVILWLYPLMAFSNNMSPMLGILGTGLLTMTYQGLFDLAKQFLDPYDNENYGKGEDPLCVDTLVAETNSGSVRWLYGFNEMPFGSQRVIDGELFDYQLPIRGYSVEELEKMEEEKRQKDREAQEKKERETAERQKKADDDRVQKLQESVFNNTITINVTSLQDVTNVSIPASSIFKSARFTDDDKSDGGSIKLEGKSEKMDNSTKTGINVEDGLFTKVIAPEGDTPGTLTKERSQYINYEAETTPALWPTNTAVTSAVNSLGVNGGSVGTPDVVITTKNTVLAAIESPTPSFFTILSDDENLVDFSMYEDLDLWCDEIGEDGQEYRLSQQLADEEWEEEVEYMLKRQVQPPLSFDEYTEKAIEIMEAAENELLETEEILSVSPGAEVQSSQSKKRLESKRNPIPWYDQTKLDGISQLWGLPPDDPSDLVYPDDIISLDDSDFAGIAALWGRPLGKPISGAEGDLIGGSFQGITEMWGNEPASDFDGDDDEVDLSYDVATSALGTLPWFDEVAPDGSEYRLSQMLADEDWGVRDKPVQVKSLLTLKDYSRRIEDLKEAAEEEWKETKAILDAAPGADILNDEDSSTKSGKKYAKAQEQLDAPTSDVEDSLDVLEMDVVDEVINGAAVSFTANVLLPSDASAESIVIVGDSYPSDEVDMSGDQSGSAH